MIYRFSKISKVIICFILIIGSTLANAKEANERSMDWQGLEKAHIALGLPLLVVKGSKGFLACGYLSVEACNKTGEACAIVSGVMSHDDMLVAKIKAVSDSAKALGIKLGMKGSDALKILR